MCAATPLSMLTKVYGKNIIVSRIKGYNIIHLDSPTEKTIKKRIKKIMDGHVDNDLEDDCPLCQTMKSQPCDIVYFRQ